MNIFIRGDIGIGKSTAIDKAVTAARLTQSITLGGFMSFMSPEVRKIYITDASLPRDYSRAELLGEPASGAVPDVLDHWAERVAQSAESADLIILDELGFIEQRSSAFKNAVFKCLDSEKDVLGVLKIRDVPWYADILSRKDVFVIHADKGTRDGLPEKIAALLFSGAHFKQ